MKPSTTDLSASHETRLARYAKMSTALALLSEERLRDLVDDAVALNNGIGGMTALMQLEDTSSS